MLRPYDPTWPGRAARLLTAVERAVEPLGVAQSFEHIGSTSVPGLTAKAYVDLQVLVGELPPPELLDPALAAAGFVPTTGARPDSPGVHRDVPRGSEQVPDEVWRERLFVHDVDGPGAAILHVRLAASPWGRHTLWFRDWLRAHPDARDRYASFKARVAADHAGDADHDDHTRAKTGFFDEVQEQFEAWGRRRAR